MKKQYTRKQIQEAIAYWESELRRMDEDRGLGRNILKALGQRDKDDDFEDAVNAANDGNKAAVLKYVDSALKRIIRNEGFQYGTIKIQKGSKDLPSYDDWTFMMEEFVKKFKTWAKKKPNRYRKFFTAVKDEINSRNAAWEAFENHINQLDVPGGIGRMSYNQQHDILGKVAQAAVDAIESAVGAWYGKKSPSKFEKFKNRIIGSALGAGITATEKGVSSAELPFKYNKDFMRYCGESETYRKFKELRSANRAERDFIYYLEHDRPIAKQEKKKYGGDWNYDPAYASPENNNSPWHRG